MDSPLRRSEYRYLGRIAGRSSAAELPAPDLSGFTREQIALASRAWTLKAEEEYRSAAVFAEITSRLIEAAAPLDVLAALGRVVQDEIAHATLCFDLAARFGAPTPVAATGRVQQRLERLGTDRTRQGLALLLFEGAIGETVSVTLFHAGRKGSREPCTRAALGLILRDEARHARLCWEASALLLPSATPETREALQLDLARSFGAFEQGMTLPALRRLEAGEAFDPALASLGVIPPELRVETIYGAVERVVLPRLNELGFDAQRAWAERYRT
jgi:hypothetical protein